MWMDGCQGLFVNFVLGGRTPQLFANSYLFPNMAVDPVSRQNRFQDINLVADMGKESISYKNWVGETVRKAEAVSDFRRTLPQWLATIAKNLLTIDLGMVIAFPTIVIPPLLHAEEGLRLNMIEASWLGSMVYFCQPLGSLIAAVVLDFLGRKWTMVFLNIPFLSCWVAMYYVGTIPLLFILSGIMGFAIGSIEAPILTYIGEISEPKMRGTLTSVAEITEYMGFVFIFFLGTVTDWRTSALISAAVPIISAICLLQVPETPIWLLSKGRDEEALKSLCWLRGWVKPELVQVEFEELKQYNHASKFLSTKPKNTDLQNSYFNDVNLSDENAQRTNNVGSIIESNISQEVWNSPGDVNEPFEDATPQYTFKERMVDFFRREMMLPMFLVCSFFFFTYGSGMLAMRPYMVPIFTHLGFIMDPYLATAVFTAIGLGGCVICTVSVRWLGKRPLALFSVAGCGISAFSLCAYAYYIDVMEGQKQSWIPQTFMVCYAFFTGVGMDPLPWMYLSEVFPFRGRGLACGIAAGISYFMGFIATKTYLILENSLSLSGVFFLYGCFNVVGFIYFYFYLLETEGKTMEEIEEGYRKGKRSTTL